MSHRYTYRSAAGARPGNRLWQDVLRRGVLLLCLLWAVGAAGYGGEEASGEKMVAAVTQATIAGGGEEREAWSGAPTRLRLQLKWRMQFQFAGYVVAREKGFYAAEGLEVELLPGGPEVNIVSEVMSGRADIGISEPSLMLERAAGNRLVVLAAVFQHSPSMIISLKAMGIEKAQDLAGRRLMLTDDIAPVVASLLKHEGIPFSIVKLQPHSGNIADLLEGRTDAMSVYSTNELPQLERMGVEVNRLLPLSYGLDIYGDCLFAPERWAEDNPEIIARFLRATQEGWRYAFKHEDETIALLRERYGVTKSVDMLKAEAEASRALILPELIEIGHMNPLRWEHIARMYREMGLLPPDFTADEFIYDPYFTNRKFARQVVYGAGTIIVLALSLALLLMVFNRRLKSAVVSRTRQLEENQTRLALALEGTNDGIWDWNVATDEVYYNPEWVRNLGYRLEEFTRTYNGLLSFIHPDDVDEFVHGKRDFVTSSAGEISAEFRLRRSNGTWRWIHSHGRAQARDSLGRVLRVVGTNVDITDKKLKTEKLQDRLAALTSPVGGASDVRFNDVFDIEKIQMLQDAFAESFDISSVLVTPEGSRITRASGRIDECGIRNCLLTPAQITLGRRGIEPFICPDCGQFFGGAGILAGQVHLANWLVAREVAGGQPGSDPAGRERFGRICRTLELFASQLSELAFQNVVQARVIYERTRAEQLLLENEAILKEAQAIAHVGHWSYKVKEDVIDGSEEMRRILGLSRTGTFSLDEIAQVGHPDDRATFRQSMSEALRTGEPLKSNYRVVVQDAVRHVHVRGVSFGGADGKPEYMLGIIQDISERVRREMALREQEENLRITLDAIGDGVIATDHEGRITRMNPVAQELTGWNIMEAIGRPVAEVFGIVHAETRQKVADPVQEVLEKGRMAGIPEQTLLLARDESARLISDSAAPIRNEKGVLVGAVLVFRDITGQHQLEQQLRQAQKMEAIGQLAGGVAHDFNNLLGGIMGFAELLSLGGADAEKQHYYANQITVTAERAAQLTSQLLTFARKGKLPSTPFDLHVSVEQALDILRHSLDRKIEIKVNFSARHHVITGDPAQIQNAILNLGINARDAMPEGGLLEVLSCNCHLSREYCEESTFEIQPGRYIKLTIRDTGVGIDPEVRGKIFEPFFTTKQVGKGTGLGLSAVFGTVTSHGGAITVQSAVGQGTEFHIYLPLAETYVGPREREISYDLQKRGKGQIILVIDDEPVIRAMASTLLEEAGYKTLTAQNGQEGVDIYRDNRDKIEAVIVDMVMPVLDGLEAMKLLKKINPEVRVLAASGFSRNEKINQMLHEGARGFLHKPYTLGELIDKLHQALAP